MPGERWIKDDPSAKRRLNFWHLTQEEQNGQIRESPPGGVACVGAS